MIENRLLVNDYVSIKNCRHGLFMYNLNDLFIGRALDIYGEWCDAELTCLEEFIKTGDVIVDAGANIGTHTVFFAKRVGVMGAVYAFEPQHITFEFLCANMALNGLMNVFHLQMGIGDKSSETTVPVLDPHIAQNFGNLSIENNYGGERVGIIPLDAFELKRCNLIKIDVEGMEVKVLQGAEKTIQNLRPILFVENNGREGNPELVQKLFDLDYDCRWHIANYYNPRNFFNNTDNVWTNFVPESNMLCVPKEIEQNILYLEPVICSTDSWVQAIERLRNNK
jgi:FkbM family methyltransferase